MFKGYVKVNWQQLSEDCAAVAGKTKDNLTKQGKVIPTFDFLIVKSGKKF